MLFTAVYILRIAVCYGVGLAIYRLRFHPLAKLPGPKLTAITKWWEFYIDAVQRGSGLVMYGMERMHAEYGAVQWRSNKFN